MVATGTGDAAPGLSGRRALWSTSPACWPAWRGRLVVAAVMAALTSVTACDGDSGDGGSPPEPARAGSPGGTLRYYVKDAFPTVDPQRIYAGVVITSLARTVYRQLVAFPISTDPKTGIAPVPDLATDTGTASKGGRTWSFTLKDGVTWEDGRPITCEDLRYGAARAFATDVMIDGPKYLLSYLDIPADPATGLPAYKGPYAQEGQALFDKAVTCNGKTITYRFNRPWPDFPLAIASLHMLDPYRKDQDQGGKSRFRIFSNGPYRLEGNVWKKNKGATLVRNENYDPRSDSTDLRRALPDEIDFDFGQTPETITDRLIADRGSDQQAITSESVPPADYSQIAGDVAARSVLAPSPYVLYLVPNFRTEAMSDPTVREALKVSTNVDAYLVGLGGDNAGGPAESIVHPALIGYRENPAFSGSNTGDPSAARQMLEDAGIDTPVAIIFTYAWSETADKAAAALKDTWDQAGFDVTLDAELGPYEAAGRPDKDSEVTLSGWGADWPSAITVAPEIFDSRTNLTADSKGNDIGSYDSDEFNARVDEARSAATLEDQTAALQRADAVLGRDVAYIPLQVVKFFLLHGSQVTGYVSTPSSNGYPDLGPIGVVN
jgi:peptide/nickel transport system substrate-binding protein